jgi:hypothetical protein
MMVNDECGSVAEMLGKGNRSTRRKSAPLPLCPPQIPHDMTRARPLAASAGSRLLTAKAMGRPHYAVNSVPILSKVLGSVFHNM